LIYFQVQEIASLVLVNIGAFFSLFFAADRS